MSLFYTTERNVQMLIYLMKQHGVRKVIASPGATNVTFVASIQQDPYFEIYSAADERSAAYIACGLAAESGESVAISCTGATASRNYVPGLTEAYYRKLPILAVTSTQHTGRIGQLCPQVIDRSIIQNDIAVMSVNIPFIYSKEDEWDCNVKLNRALLALKHRGGGPVHINLTTNYCRDFSAKNLPETRVIRRITKNDKFPEINAEKVGIFVGAHLKWSIKLTDAVDRFCEAHNGVVLCDHTSNYQGKYRIQYNLICGQIRHTDLGKMDLLIDMGEMSGSYMSIQPKNVWRVNSDGEIRDTFRKLTYLFDMTEEEFFAAYSGDGHSNLNYYGSCKKAYDELAVQIPEMPFSNLWIAQNTIKKLPKDSILHLGILNSLRCWNFFETSTSINCYANTGGFGIDGIVSTLVGASLADKEKLHFLVVGDLAFFYDLNAIANRNVGNNIRILLVNNGCGTEFRNYNHFAAQFGEDAKPYIAAEGHYGKQSKELIKNYAENLGFIYLCASDKEEYLNAVDKFVDSRIGDKSIIFEVFTSPEDESAALKLINCINEPSVTDVAKSVAKSILGEKNVKAIADILKG